MSCWGTLSGPFPQPHSHLVKHIGYGEATAQVLGTGTGWRDVECLQLGGEERPTRRVSACKKRTTPLLHTFLISRNLSRRAGAGLMLQHTSSAGVASAHLETEGGVASLHLCPINPVRPGPG